MDKPGKETSVSSAVPPPILDAQWLRELAMECGADDVAFVEAESPALKSESAGIAALLPGAASVAVMAVRANRDALRSPWMGIVNREAAFANKEVDDAASKLGRKLASLGIRNVPVHAAFPMDTQKWPGKIWPVSHKTIAEAAGLGRMGHHRLLIHPSLGSSIYLSTLILDRPVSSYGSPLAETPCDGCKLCAAACPTGAIGADGRFNFVNCATHNYRYRLGGFSDWIENVAGSRNVLDYRSRATDSETVSMWQSLSCGNNYTCLNCLAVCPAGGKGKDEDADAPTPAKLVRGLLARIGSVFVIRNSDAEEHARRHLPPERIRVVGSGTRPTSARGFLSSLGLVFQPGRARGLDAVYHFDFRGRDPCCGTVTIRDSRIVVTHDLSGKPDLTVKADGDAWVSLLRKEKGLLLLVLTGRIKVKGPLRLLAAFSRCFPS